MIDKYLTGCKYLLGDDLVSYHSFFTVIFAEIIYMWAINMKFAYLYTMMLVFCIVNVFVVAWCKGLDFWQPKKLQKFLEVIYVIIYACTFIMGWSFSKDFVTTCILFAIPFLWTAFAIWLRESQYAIAKILAPDSIIASDIIWIVTQLFLLIAPLNTMAYMTTLSNWHISFKIALCAIALFFAPIWAYIEDEFVALNIFELAYEEA